jgi:hypothetical protein
MLTKTERLRVRNEIVKYLLGVQRYDEQDICNLHALTGIDREIIWEAREVVRLEHGIDFGPIRNWPGSFERKTWEQIEHRARRQRSKGTRAHRRAEERLRLAATLAPSEAQSRLNDAADRIALRVAMRAAKGS